MTITHRNAARPPPRPRAGAAPARPRRGPDHRRLLGAAAGRQRRRDPRAHRALAGARGLDRATSTSPPPARCPRAGAAASSPTPRSTSCSRRWPGRSAAPTTPASRPGFAPSSPGSRPRRSRTATSTRSSAGPGRRPRWSDLEWGHELYCFGHLFQAAVARARTRPGRRRRPARRRPPRGRPRVRRVRRRTASSRVCGHPEIEPALVELARVDGRVALPRRRRALFVERRGHGALRDIEWGRAYYQDDIPVREATVLRGHAVRANYLSAGAVDVAVETRRRRAARRALPRSGRTRSRGARTSPAVRARTTRTRRSATTGRCRPIGRTPRPARPSRSVMFSWRLLLAEVTPRYADLIERTLYNVVATSPSHDGTAFYYANTLHQRRAGRVPRDGRAVPARVVVAAGAVVRGVLLPAQRRAHARQPRRVRRDRRRRRRPAAPVRTVAHPHRLPDGRVASRSRSRRPTPATGLSGCASLENVGAEPGR